MDTLDQLKTKLDALGDISGEQRKSIVCSLVGHSRIQSACFGYYYCGRCGDQVGDALGGAYDARDVVIVGHDCSVCRDNYEKLDWKHTYLCADPFTPPAA